jgi:hypothetical protein
MTHLSVLPSAMLNGVGTPVAIISQLNTLPACAPVNASMAASRLAMHDSGSGWLAKPFLHDSFIHYSTPVYPGALSILLRGISCGSGERVHRPHPGHLDISHQKIQPALYLLRDLQGALRALASKTWNPASRNMRATIFMTARSSSTTRMLGIYRPPATVAMIVPLNALVSYRTLTVRYGNVHRASRYGGVPCSLYTKAAEVAYSLVSDSLVRQIVAGPTHFGHTPGSRDKPHRDH